MRRSNLGEWLEVSHIHDVVGLAIDPVLVFPVKASRAGFLAFQAKHQEIFSIPKSYIAIATFAAVSDTDLKVCLRNLSGETGCLGGLVQACAGGFKTEHDIDEPVPSNPVDRQFVALTAISNIPLEYAPL